MALNSFELREFLLHIFRRVDEETDIRFAKHGGVVVGIAGGNDVVIQRLQRGDGFLFLIRLAQLVAGDAVVRTEATPPKAFIEESEIVIKAPVGKRTAIKKSYKAKEKREESIAKKGDVSNPPVPAPPPPAPRIVVKYVADPTLIEFTFMDRERQEPAKPVTGDKPLPYVPKSTFYYPVDSTKTIISL